MTAWLRPVWRWGWLPSLLLVAWLLPWCMNVLRHFEVFGIERQIEPFAVRLGELAHDTLRSDWRRWRTGLAPGSPIPSGVRQLHLYCDRLGELDRELPASGRRYVSGQLQIDGRLQRVGVRYRGDTYVHWGRAKKSFRIKLKGKARLAGIKTFNLCVAKYPAQLNNFLGYALAAQLDLLAPHCEPVMLWLNGQRHGAYWLIEQPKARLLRRAGRHPGSLYKGELLCRDAWTGVDNDRFRLPGLWEADHFASPDERRAADDALARLLRCVQQPMGAESVATLASLLDLDRFARLSLFEQISQTHHFDHFHNWRLHWDARRRRFEPLIWDPVGWQENMRPPPGAGIDHHPAFTALHAHLHACAEFLLARERAVVEFFTRGGEQELLHRLDEAMRTNAVTAAADPRLWPPDRALVDRKRDEFAAAVRANLAALRATWIDAPLEFTWSAPAERSLVVRTQSPRGIRGLRLRLRNASVPNSVAVVVPRVGGRRERIDLSGCWHADGGELVLQVALPSAVEPQFEWRAGSYQLRNHRLRTVATDYEFELGGIDPGDVLSVRGIDSNVRGERLPDLQVSSTGALYGLAAVRRR